MLADFLRLPHDQFPLPRKPLLQQLEQGIHGVGRKEKIGLASGARIGPNTRKINTQLQKKRILPLTNLLSSAVAQFLTVHLRQPLSYLSPVLQSMPSASRPCRSFGAWRGCSARRKSFEEVSSLCRAALHDPATAPERSPVSFNEDGDRHTASTSSASLRVLSSAVIGGMRATIAARSHTASAISFNKDSGSSGCHNSTPRGRVPLSLPNTGTPKPRASITEDDTPSVSGVRMQARDRVSIVRNTSCPTEPVIQ